MDKSINWDAFWANTDYTPLAEPNFFTEIFNIFVPEAHGNLTALEIGCFPGRFIEYIGRKGYVVSGIDTYPNVLELNKLFRQRDLRVGIFSRTDFNDFFGRFNLVISVGFIEHFRDWPRILMKHIECTKPGGRIIINCPNFASPLQRAMHLAVDKTNIDQHVLSAMYPALWRSFLKLVGMDVVFCDQIGLFQFWTETVFDPESNEYKLQQALLSAGNWLHKIRGAFESKESGYCLAVADRPQSWTPDQNKIAVLCDEFQKISILLDSKDQLLADQLLNSLKSVITMESR